jgi:hypothetical protein
MPGGVSIAQGVVEDVAVAVQGLGIARPGGVFGLLAILATKLEPEAAILDNPIFLVQPDDEAPRMEVDGEAPRGGLRVLPNRARAPVAQCRTRHEAIGTDEAGDNGIVVAGMVVEQPGVVLELAGVVELGLRDVAGADFAPRLELLGAARYAAASRGKEDAAEGSPCRYVSS